MDLIYVNNKTDKTELIMTVLVPVLAGTLSFVLVKNHTGIYTNVAQGSLLPPIIILPIIWVPVLFFMGIASYRMKLAVPKSAAHTYYAVSLLAGFVWNILLFRFGELRAAFATIIVYLLFSFLTFSEFEKNDKTSGYLMFPAFLWGVALAAMSFFLCKAHGVF